MSGTFKSHVQLSTKPLPFSLLLFVFTTRNTYFREIQDDSGGPLCFIGGVSNMTSLQCGDYQIRSQLVDKLGSRNALCQKRHPCSSQDDNTQRRTGTNRVHLLRQNWNSHSGNDRALKTTACKDVKCISILFSGISLFSLDPNKMIRGVIFRPSATSCRIGLMESRLHHRCHGGPPPLASYPPPKLHVTTTRAALWSHV